MMQDVKRAIQECAKRRIMVRPLPNGAFRVSLPIARPDQHLVELSFKQASSDAVLRVSDGGEFFSFVHEERISRKSKAYEDALESFEKIGFQKVGKSPAEELVATLTLDEVGCLSLDFGATLVTTFSTLTRDLREGIPHYERKVWAELKPVHSYLKQKVEVAPKIVVPIAAKNSNIVATVIGSYGETIEPGEVARRQLFPFYRLLTQPKRRFDKYALVDEGYLREPEVRQMLEEVSAKTISRKNLHEFERIVKERSARVDGGANP